MIKTTEGQRLKMFIEALGLSHEEAAQRSGYGRRHFQHSLTIEPLKEVFLSKVCNALDIPPDLIKKDPYQMADVLREQIAEMEQKILKADKTLAEKDILLQSVVEKMQNLIKEKPL